MLYYPIYSMQKQELTTSKQIVEGYVKQIRELKQQQLQLEMIIANH